MRFELRPSARWALIGSIAALIIGGLVYLALDGNTDVGGVAGGTAALLSVVAAAASRGRTAEQIEGTIVEVDKHLEDTLITAKQLEQVKHDATVATAHNAATVANMTDDEKRAAGDKLLGGNGGQGR